MRLNWARVAATATVGLAAALILTGELGRYVLAALLLAAAAWMFATS